MTEIKIKKSCRKCGYIDKNLGREQKFKCHTKSCPDNFWSEKQKIDFLKKINNRYI